MAHFDAPSTNGSASPELGKMPLIPYESDVPRLREIYQRNQSSFIHRFFPEIRNMIMEYCVALEYDIMPEPVFHYAENHDETSINKFIWGKYEEREGTINGREAIYYLPTSGPLAVVSLRLTCRQFYHELEGVFYKVNTFMFETAGSCEEYLAALTIQRRRQIHNISLDLTASNLNPWITTPQVESQFLTKKLHSISKLLMVNCPLLKRLIVFLGDRPETIQMNSERQKQYLPSIEFQRSHLLFKQADRNPTRVFAEMGSHLSGIQSAIDDLMTRTSAFSHPKLEFFISGSPTMFARVDGRTTHRSRADAPRYILDFEDKLEMVNKKMQEFYKKWPDPQTDEFLSDPKHHGDILLVESTRMKEGPVPAFKDFQFAAPTRGDTPCECCGATQGTHWYDVNGVILWKNVPNPRRIFDIIWKDEEIVCGVIYTCGCSAIFEPISRFASWDGVSRIFNYFVRDLKRLYNGRPVNKRKLLLMFTEYPSPKDIDAALRATGLLHNNEASTEVRRNWERFLKKQDKYIADMEREVKWAFA
ncbi:hypothetical protein F5Y09DRAFT_356706 [Xylaria sp. FL1042]|nr:hypothetical protein F5Y09DRAFT_356706 [Xylaria sp. FL1042]